MDPESNGETEPLVPERAAPRQTEASPPDPSVEPATRAEPVDPPRPTAASPDSSGGVAAPSVALPAIPDLRPQLAVFVQTVVHNQEMTIQLLRDIQQLIATHAAELRALREQLGQQQSMMCNLRRF